MTQARGNNETLAPFHNDMEHLPHLPDRIERQARRLAPLLDNPAVDFRKAVLKSTGELVGVALWMFTRQGDKPQNLKRRYIEIVREGREKEQEEDDWKGVKWEKWNECWAEWDGVRDGLMNGREHWCKFLVLSPPPKGIVLGSPGSCLGRRRCPARPCR